MNSICKKNDSHYPFLVKLIVSMLLFVYVFSIPVTANAASVVTIQCSIDTASWEIVSAVVKDEIDINDHSPEVKRVKRAYLEAMKSDNSLMSIFGTDSTEMKKDLKDKSRKIQGNILGGFLDAGEKNRVLTFPGENVFLSDGEATAADYTRALEVNDALIHDLNQAFSMWLEKESGITKKNDPEAYYDAMLLFLTKMEGLTSSNSDYLEYEDIKFRWKIDKGYTSGNYGLRHLTEDTEHITWGMLAFEAFNNYALEGDEAVTVDNVYSASPGQLEKTLAGLLSSVLNGLRGVLGFWSMDELIFNQGLRENGYVGGIFPRTWEAIVWGLFIVMEVLAAMILMVAVVLNIFKKAMSTMNTAARVDVMEQAQDLILCAIGLAILPLALRIVISLSGDLTGMFYELVPKDGSGNKKAITDMVVRFSQGGGTVSSIIAQFMYFGVQVYFNFFYMLRALTVALLVVIAPIMVAMIAVSNSRKQATVDWAKELLANILIQPIHALVMMFVLLAPSSSHAFDNLIVLYAIIPFTEVVKSFFFGNAGSFTAQNAQLARRKVTGAIGGAATAAGAAMALGGVRGVQAHHEQRKAASGEGGGDAGGSATGNTATTSTSVGGLAMDADGNPIPVPEASDSSSTAAASGPASTRLNTAAENSGSGHIGGALKSLSAAPGYMAAFGKGALSATPQAGVAALGGAMSGAGVGGYGAMSLASMSISSVHNKKRPNQQAPAGASGSNGGAGGEGTGGSAGAVGFAAAGMSSEGAMAVPNTMGGDQSAFHNRGDVLDADSGEMTRRYEASASQLEANGITDVSSTSRGRDVSFTADPTKSAEGAALAAYAQTLQNLPDDNARKELINQTGISATMLDDGRVAATINNDKYSAAHDGARLSTMGERVNGEYKNGLRMQGPTGVSQSFAGGIRPNTAIPQASLHSVASNDTSTVQRISSEGLSSSQRAALDTAATGYQTSGSSYQSGLEGVTNVRKVSGGYEVTRSEGANVGSIESTPIMASTITAATESSGAVQQISGSSLNDVQRSILDNEVAVNYESDAAGATYHSVFEGVADIQPMDNGDYKVIREVGYESTQLNFGSVASESHITNLPPQVGNDYVQEIRVDQITPQQTSMMHQAYQVQEQGGSPRLEGVRHISYQPASATTPETYRVTRTPGTNTTILREQPHTWHEAAANTAKDPSFYAGAQPISHGTRVNRANPSIGTNPSMGTNPIGNPTTGNPTGPKTGL